jgi:DNA polymerase I-like protein with 3'-5' exonuclease and polymerase domains
MLVSIDCEWHNTEEGDEEKRCKCGRDLPEGTLETIGIGNEHWVGQWNWVELDDYRKVEAREALARMVQRVPVVYHNAIADIKKLRENGFEITPATHYRIDDTMLADAVLNSEEEHTLYYLTVNYGKLPQHKHLRHAAPDLYNAADVVETVLIWKFEIVKQLAADPQARLVYETMSIPFLDLALEGEEAGIRVDKTKPLALYDKFTVKVDQGQALAQAATGRPINLNSNDQKLHYVYNVLEYPVQRKRDHTATLNKDALAALRKLDGTEWDADDEPTLDTAWENIEHGAHPLLEAMYLHSGARHYRSSYVIPLLVTEGEDETFKILGIRDRVYPSCRMHAQTSGRHGYVGPALSQFRGAVELQLTPDVGYCWIGHDWSNIETWHLGYIANDPLILEAKRLNWDTHTVNFCDATGTPRPPKLDKRIHTCGCADCSAWRREYKWTGDEDLRRTFFKRFVYRLHYRGLAENCGDIPGARALKMDVPRLIQASELYLAKHEPIREYWRRSDERVDRENLSRTFMGRPRRLTGEYRNSKLREAANHEMQGGVADIYITTALRVKAVAPWARLVYGKFDSQWWQVPNERRFEFAALYAPIVEANFNVYGRTASYPASYKLREAA